MLNNGEAIVDAKVPDDVGAFKNWLRQINPARRRGIKEGGFLGIGGVPVNEAEKATLTEISNALRFVA